MGSAASSRGTIRVRSASGNQPSSDDIVVVSFYSDLGRRADHNITWADEEEDISRSPTPPPEATQVKLKILSLDLKEKVNAEQHHTDEIEDVKGLLIRRGQAFTLVLKLNRKYDDSSDLVKFDFRTGSHPVNKKRTLVFASTKSSSLQGKGWELKISDITNDTLTVSITSAPDALVGQYSLQVFTSASGRASYVELQPIYLLFNPWCEDDQVYLKDEKEQEEYVLKEKGLIWYGNSRQLASRPWGFNQFEKVVFEVVMSLLKKHVKDAALGSPVLVARAMSAAVNSQDDNGVLSGRWDGDYAPYTIPTKWTGSQAILEEYFKKKAPVCYGQCWVFSGVLTTVLRCLGIPTRSVTNFSSAHDTDTSLTIDKHFYPDGEPAKGYNSDSVWNFHVWNESWMARPDLPKGFGGWQAVDATPQETSEGVYCTGPCSVKAIREGHVYYPYDARFVFAEVNGDIVNWEVKGKGANAEFMFLRVKSRGVGMKISTKEVGTNARNDLTQDYKYPDGSDEERAVMVLAAQYGTNAFLYDKPDVEEDVNMSVQVPDATIGSDIDIVVPMTNRSSEHRTISMHVTVHSCYYTGVDAKKIKAATMDLELRPNESTEEKLHVDADEYMDKLVDQGGVKVTVVGHVKETGQDFGDEEDFRLRTPDLDVKLIHPAADKIHRGDKVQVEIKLTNPLKTKLSNCEFDIEGSGVLAPTTLKHGVIEANGIISKIVDVYPTKQGKRALVITFESDQLSQVTGELDFIVQKK